jgi:high-affinity nickel-transport protein
LHLADNLGWESAFLDWFDTLQFLGYAIVGTLIATWLIALLVWRVGRFEEKLRMPPRGLGPRA